MRGSRRWCSAPGVKLATRALTPPVLLETVRNDPGMTASYYANRYFGSDRAMLVSCMLWSELKLYGQVTLDRIDGPDSPPRWHPVMSYPPKIHRARRHNAEDEDLSVLRDTPVPPVAPQSPKMPERPGGASDDATPSLSGATAPETSATEASGGGADGGLSTAGTFAERVEDQIIRLVQKEPGKDIQSYISELPPGDQPLAPSAFRRLRETNVLVRARTPQGTFVWRP